MVQWPDQESLDRLRIAINPYALLLKSTAFPIIFLAPKAIDETQLK